MHRQSEDSCALILTEAVAPKPIGKVLIFTPTLRTIQQIDPIRLG
jgi:hypothetical protein